MEGGRGPACLSPTQPFPTGMLCQVIDEKDCSPQGSQNNALGLPPGALEQCLVGEPEPEEEELEQGRHRLQHWRLAGPRIIGAFPPPGPSKTERAGVTERGLQAMRPMMQQSRLGMSSSEVGTRRRSQDQVQKSGPGEQTGTRNAEAEVVVRDERL
ncbi:hypothetical protein D4764_13G0000020, partial [Takifugu flavidus]